jgi:hypothetical protein
VPEGETQEHLIRAAVEILRPIVKYLLVAGVPFGRLETRLREVFVEVAEQELTLPDRPQTDSRIALLTGINRKEVHRLRSADAAKTRPGSFGRNQAASLVSRWLIDARATDRAGKPRPLPYQAESGASFVQLVRQVAPDLPPRAILDELARTGAVIVSESGMVSLVTDSFVPRAARPEKLKMLAEDPAELVETMLRNVFSEGEGALLQRKVYYDRLGADGVGRARAQMRREGEQFLRRVNRLLAHYDRDRNPDAPGGERRYAGVGVYYFEGAFVPEAPQAAKHRSPEKKRSTRKRRR